MLRYLLIRFVTIFKFVGARFAERHLQLSEKTRLNVCLIRINWIFLSLQARAAGQRNLNPMIYS